MVSFIDAFKEFFRKWWYGYNNVAKDMAREIGFCVGVMRQGNFVRDVGLFEWAMKAIPFNEFRQLNIFTSVAYYINIDDVNMAESRASYDRVYYDFDSKDNPKLAIDKALEFAKSLKARFNVDAVVAFSGLHGAHITIPLKKPISWAIYARLWDILIAPYDFKELVDKKVR
ncbi:MAG: hypothetical protein LM583_10425, partial [Desulfurococcaceae archaeon]|nr:hypothetical protein [Desulfurococcaceae archaeon]